MIRDACIYYFSLKRRLQENTIVDMSDDDIEIQHEAQGDKVILKISCTQRNDTQRSFVLHKCDETREGTDRTACDIR